VIPAILRVEIPERHLSRTASSTSPVIRDVCLVTTQVHRHVSKVLKKLGLGSREQVAAKLDERRAGEAH